MFFFILAIIICIVIFFMIEFVHNLFRCEVCGGELTSWDGRRWECKDCGVMQ